MIATPNKVGQPIKRKEDPRFITGKGRFTDDIKLPGMLHMAVLRSDRAHARIRKIDTRKAEAIPGVVKVLIGKDIVGAIPPLPCAAKNAEGNHWLAGVPMNVPDYTALATDKVGFVGHNIAVVVANDPYTAQDALDAIKVDFEDLPVVMDPVKAAQPGSPVIHEQFGNNLVFNVPGGPSPEAIAATEEALKNAQHRAHIEIDNQRLIPMAMEPRAAVADWDVGRENLTVYTSTQIPHWVRTFLGLMLGIAEHRIRVVAPDVGGGFGSKLNVYPEEYLVVHCSRLLGRPVKWTNRRREEFTNTIHGRGQVQHIDIGFNSDGTWTAMKAKLYLDLGAYMMALTPGIATFTVVMMTGCYKPKAYCFEQVGVFTNKMATDAYRGAGRPEATFIAEKVMDTIAATLKMDPTEVRRKNYLTEFPATPPTGLVYDSGDYNKAMDKAKQVVGYDALRREQQQARAQGRLMGIGVCSYVELCGVGPSFLAPPGVGFWESCTVRVEPTGLVTVLTGISPHGQGEETTFAQIVSDQLGVPMENVRVVHSDTDAVPYGNGTYGSRGIAMGGQAMMMSIDKVKDKAKQLGAHMLDAQKESMTFDRGDIYVTSNPQRKVTLGQVAMAAYDFSWKGPGTAPPGVEPGLEATSRFEPSNLTFPFGTHICVVDVDKETGEVAIKRYVAVDDCGTIINPLIVDGQVHGGIAQGLAQSLYEDAVYDADGQLVTGELLEYAVPKSSMVPHYETHHTVTPSPVNSLGAKGIGEAGTIGSTAAIFNAVMDALAPLGIKHIDMPLKPEKVWRAIQKAKSA
ncbi:MAG: xanthine dehydrogenase family protein molybdopterin-binding subunit [Candidatus Lambdaproteobacteria bacterium]|nr:xanthine dehydrogenase family protein molybdopterin-binding subunit [Candidatus Lambdaproteobacteria bacterium]